MFSQYVKELYCFHSIADVWIANPRPFVASDPPVADYVKNLLVEVNGVEPMTPCLQSRCSSQLSYTPNQLVAVGSWQG